MTALLLSGGGLVLLIVIGILYGTQPDHEETKTTARVVSFPSDRPMGSTASRNEVIR